MLDPVVGEGQGQCRAAKMIMSQVTPPNALAAQVTRLWNEPLDRPRALIFLATPGREPGNLREIAQGLGLGYIRLDLTQAVTPGTASAIDG